MDTLPAYSSETPVAMSAESKCNANPPAQTGMRRKGYCTLIEGLVTPSSLPDEYLHPSPPVDTDIPNERAYPKCIVRNGNIISPQSDPHFVLYHLAEATYPVKYGSTSSSTQMTKLAGAISGNEHAYTIVERSNKPKRYTNMMALWYVNTSDGERWTMFAEAAGSYDLDIQLQVDPTPKTHRSIVLSISKRWRSAPHNRPTPVKLRRAPVAADQELEAKPTTSQHTHSWVDQTTGNVLALEAKRVNANTDGGSNEQDTLTFSDSPSVNYQLRDIITAAWVISLWVDVWAEKKSKFKSKFKQDTNLFGRFLNGIFGSTSQSKEEQASLSVVARNPLREELGLDAPNPNYREHLFWYESGPQNR